MQQYEQPYDVIKIQNGSVWEIKKQTQGGFHVQFFVH